MNNFIKIRGRLYNANLIMYVEEFEDSEVVYLPETRESKANCFTSIRMYFSKDDYVQIRCFTIKDLQEFLNKKKASQ